MLATLKIHSSLQKFFDAPEYRADFGNFFDVMFYLNSMHPRFKKYANELGDSPTVDESFCLMDSKLNLIDIDSYHIKKVKEDDTIYLVPLVGGGGGKRGTMFLLAFAVIAGPAIAASLSASAGGVAAQAGVMGGIPASGAGAAGGGFFAGIKSAFAGGGFMKSMAMRLLGNVALSMVSRLFTKKPKQNETDTSTREAGMFGSITNSTQSGTPVALHYGLVRVGGQFISGYVESEEHGKNDIVNVGDKF